jgi:hypothetical protein
LTMKMNSNDFHLSLSLRASKVHNFQFRRFARKL